MQLTVSGSSSLELTEKQSQISTLEKGCKTASNCSAHRFMLLSSRASRHWILTWSCKSSLWIVLYTLKNAGQPLPICLLRCGSWESPITNTNQTQEHEPSGQGLSGCRALRGGRKLSHHNSKSTSKLHISLKSSHVNSLQVIWDPGEALGSSCT